MNSNQPDSHRASALRKLDSTVVLEPLDSTTSSHTYMRQQVSPCGSDDEHESGSGAAPIALDLAIRFGRLGAVSVVVIGLVATLTVTFNRGVVLGDFDPTEKGPDALKKLLDDYNSYTGNVAALFGKPIELFVALAVQLVLLRVLTASMLRAQMSWKLDVLALVLSAGVGFLLNNSLNALNVQVQPPKIDAVISAVDLRYAPEFSILGARATNLTHTFSERTAKNPITNTALRNLVLPRVPVATTLCDWEGSQRVIASSFFPDLSLEYGFAQRDWHGRLLQEALEPSQLRLVVNATSQTANQSVDSKDLPMSASRAGELFAYSMFVSSTMFPWSEYFSFKEQEYLQTNFSKNRDLPARSVARASGVLPNTTTALDETAQREWFLRESGKALLRKLNGPVNNGTGAVNTSRSDVVMEFSHVEISPTVHFDAFTIEFEVDPSSFTQTTSRRDNTTRYHNVARAGQCGPWPAQCLMPKPLLVPTSQRGLYDPPAQVQVFGSCVDANGVEQVAAKMVSDGGFVDLDCDKISNTALMVVSVGKRFVADAITENTITDANGNLVSSSDEPAAVMRNAVVTNLRRIFTFTVARLSWNVSTLTSEFNARCASDAGSCQGLRFPLAPAPNAPDQKQEIIVGVDALPTSLLPAPKFYYKPRLLPLVKLHEPFPAAAFDQYLYDTVAGDPLLPHNMGNVTWSTEPYIDELACNAMSEDRLHQVLNNHMYIEHGLQTAYTAATFFLLQNGVVKDVVQLNDEAQRLSLNFQQNKQRVELVASIPNQNTWLTLAGCGVLFLSLSSMIVWSWATSKARLGHVTMPHVVARVLLDSNRFPPTFVQRRVVDASSPDGQAPTVDGFLIDGLALQPLPRETKSVL